MFRIVGIASAAIIGASVARRRQGVSRNGKNRVLYELALCAEYFGFAPQRRNSRW